MKQSARLPMILALSWWALIWIISSIPSSGMPDLEVFSLDKLAHFGVYFILGFLLDMWLRRKAVSKASRGFIFLAVLLSALLDEYHQFWIPGRSVSFFDFLANGLGLIAAFIFGGYRRDLRK